MLTEIDKKLKLEKENLKNADTVEAKEKIKQKLETTKELKEKLKIKIDEKVDEISNRD